MINKRKILLVEDEPHIAFHLQYNLELEDYHVVPCANGLDAKKLFETEASFDLVILDVMLPDLNGFKLGKFIRSKDQHIPIIFLTARASDQDRVEGLEIGADDYVTKPFHLKELMLRIKRILQRVDQIEVKQQVNEGRELVCGSIRLKEDELLLFIDGKETKLTDLEAKLLSTFLTNPDKVLTREYLLQNVWGLKGSVETRSIDNFILRLRKILETDPSKPKMIESIRSKGYRLNSNRDEHAI